MSKRLSLFPHNQLLIMFVLQHGRFMLLELKMSYFIPYVANICIHIKFKNNLGIQLKRSVSLYSLL